MKHILILTGLLIMGLGIAAPVWAGGRQGTIGADFLKLGLGARAVGMGEAVTGASDGIEGIYWNPGAMSTLDKIEASFMHLAYWEGINLENLAYGQRINDHTVLGISVVTLGTDNINKTGIDSLGNMIDTGGSFRASNMSLSLGLGINISKEHGAGTVVKMVQGKIDGETGNAFVLDIGWIYSPRQDLRLGAALQNIGSEIKYVSEGDKLPLRLRLGVGYKIKQFEGLLVSADLVDEINEKIFNLNLGAEYLLVEMLGLRIGYNTVRTSSAGAGPGLSLGVGFWSKQYSVEYAFVPYGDLGDSHRISLGVVF